MLEYQLEKCAGHGEVNLCLRDCILVDYDCKLLRLISVIRVFCGIEGLTLKQFFEVPVDSGFQFAVKYLQESSIRQLWLMVIVTYCNCLLVGV